MKLIKFLFLQEKNIFKIIEKTRKLIYNGYDYAPVIVSYGIKEKYVIMKMDIQKHFNDILKFTKDEIKLNLIRIKI